ncbi:ABC transporter substrate-binding protein [Paraglaciecola chathamensis]|uniref:Extracellular solute-binding protein n=1 Tax=Paraglaciecola chathamensis S18K6 TaxID=1127672 RepID=A0AAV3V4E2_9ALTE|nr:extracellular solute-binding protein [Paraglaciecola chathamensis]GAC11753.1 extracellular solute-binding protein [Paraglaciecola chathamensis S18K6]
MRKLLRLFTVIGCYLALSTSVLAAQTLSVAILTTGERQTDVYRQAFSDFEEQFSRYNVQVAFYNDKDFKRLLPSWLESGEHDLLYWQAGERLQTLIEQDVIQPIDTLLPTIELQSAIQPAVFKSVSNQTGTYALPFSQYGWGFYYNKSMFKALNVSVPTSWDEFVALCLNIKSQGANPLVQATQEGWPVLAWLDFLSLDTGGEAYRDQLVSGQAVRNQDSKTLLAQFDQLLGDGLFFAPEKLWSWQQALQAVERSQATMTLTGQFVESSIDPLHEENIGFFPFPKKNGTSKGEVAPLEVWVVPRSARNKNKLTDLLRYLLTNNTTHATNLDALPVTNEDFLPRLPNERVKRSAAALTQSSNLIQFFDRDAAPSLSENLAKSLASSIHSDSIGPLTDGLFQGRNSDFEVNLGSDIAVLPQLYFASLTGLKETFFASNLMQDIYRQLGYQISVTRYTTLEASLNSYRFGIDGELVRVDAYKKLAPSLTKIPEPLANVAFYLVCKDLEMCSSSLPKGSEVLVTNDLLGVKTWAEENHLRTKRYESIEALFRTFNRSSKGLMVLGASEIIDNSVLLTDSTYRTIISVPLYHYVHNKHKELVPLIDNALKKYKATERYQALKQRYWLQHY